MIAKQALAFASATSGDAQSLLECLADIDSRAWDCFDEDGSTVLMAAARHGHAYCARLLADAGSDLEARDGAGRTALILASAGGHAECARALLLAGADPRKVGRDGRDAIDCATMNGHDRLAVMLRDWVIDAPRARSDAMRAASKPRA